MIKKLRISGAFLYPNEGNVEIASSAREAGSRFVREHMLAQYVHAGRMLLWRFTPE